MGAQPKLASHGRPRRGLARSVLIPGAAVAALLALLATAALGRPGPAADGALPVSSSSLGRGVPPLSEQSQPGGAWRFETWGSPDANQAGARLAERIESIAASPDGREAWATGPGATGETFALYHFAGGAWRRCDPRHGAAPADPACADLADLHARGLVLESVTSVDVEGRFVAVAAGWLPPRPGDPPDAVTAILARYEDGRWTVEDVPSDPAAGRQYKLRNVVFVTPDEGWALGDAVSDSADPVMLRFRDGNWVGCTASGACDAGTTLPDRRFEPPDYGSAIHVADGRVFLAGNRVVRSGSLPETYYPVLLERHGDRWEAADGFDPAGPGRSPAPTDQGWLTSFSVAEDAGGRAAGWARLSPARKEPSTTTLRLADGAWQRWTPGERKDALRDHPTGAEVVAGRAGESGAVMTTPDGPMLRYDDGEERWRVLPAPFDPSGRNPFTEGDVQAVGPDGRGGLWVVQDSGDGGPYVHRYTDRPHRPVFDDVPHPFAGDRIRALDSTPAGTVWLTGGDGALARYDRRMGWTRHRVAGWDGEAPPQLTALAVAPDGTGVAVGEGGRIATFGPQAANLVEARAGADLRAVDVAPDGSALAAGDAGALAWRPAGGDFRRLGPPPGQAAARITGVALPTADRAWLTTAGGAVIAGRRSGDGWTWNAETASPTAPLRAIAVDASGHGYAVGDGGTVLERNGDGGEPWRALHLGVSDDFTAVALPHGGGSAALIGGAAGAIWTRTGDGFRPARPGSVVDGYAAFGGSRVSGLALLPGHEPGQVEAWASIDGPDLPGALLHHASDPGDPLLNPVKPVEPLPDAPAPRPGEVSFVAFGKSDCANAVDEPCPGPSATDAISDVVSRRIVAAVDRLHDRPGGPLFAVFTGDANDHGGDVSRASRPALLNEWVDLVARPLDEAGVPALGAIGVLDLAEVRECATNTAGLCKESGQATRAGANVFWRQAMAGRVGQHGGPQEFDGVRYVRVTEDTLRPTPDVPTPTAAPDPVPAQLPTGGAHTHYAVDVVRDGRTLARLVFVDNSLGSLRASDPLQQPPEPRGQRLWLERVLRSRPAGARAVVVSTSPSYTYRPQDGGEHVADDGASLEQVALEHRVSAVVSGRIGWNALYYALAPGLHCPAPGGAHPEHPPRGNEGCGRSSRLPADLAGRGGKPTSPVPFVISSSAGGKLARDAGQGYWHGYSVIRLDASGDPARTVVEQRPILDWLAVTADRRRLRPGERMTLEGVGREPVAADAPARYHRIRDASITHRYDLLVADPRRPWLPYRDEGGRYVPLSQRHPGCRVGCVDRQTGEVRAGAGEEEPVQAIGMLSSGDLAATYPLVFAAGATRALRAPSGPTSAPRTAPPAGRPPASPAASPASGSPAPPSASANPTLDLPAFPALPSGASSASTPPEPPAPPAPAAPPTPPTPHVSTAAGAAHAAAVPGEVPRVSPVPPGAPPVKPAPKVSVRREAVDPVGSAMAHPDEDPLDPAEEAIDPREDLWVDVAPAPALPPGAATTRREPRRADLAMTALEGRDQPSAWVRGAGYGGGLIGAALVLAGGWSILRPRRRPAPATATATTRPEAW